MYGVHFETLVESEVLGRPLVYEARSSDKDDTYRLRWGEEVVWKGYSELPKAREIVYLAECLQDDPREAIHSLLTAEERRWGFR